MTVLQHIYRVWVWGLFIALFFLLFPFFALFIQRESWKPAGHFLNRVWAHWLFLVSFMPTKVEYRTKLKRGQQYIFCPNHSSYLDIPAIGYGIRGYAVFIGKASLGKAPLFGYMFRNLYISVDRKSPRSKAESMLRMSEELDKGRHLTVFPEGTIPRDNNPYLIPFKDGAFRLAIEKQVPIVPVAMPNNWKILPDDGKFMIRRKRLHVIVFEPIEVKGLTLEDVEMLKEKTYKIIDQAIREHNGLPQA